MPDALMQAADTIPVLDLGPYREGAPGALDATAAELRRVCETVGFLTIVNHGVPASLIDETFAAAVAFHAQPLDIKMRAKVDSDMRGYVPLRGSTTRATALTEARKPNENEAFFMKRQRQPDGSVDLGMPDRWPAEPAGFGDTALRYYDAMDGLAQRLLPLYARALDLPADFFATLCDRPLTNLRFTHYPPADYGADEYGLAPHTDSSFFTLLAQNKVPGLQIRTVEG